MCYDYDTRAINVDIYTTILMRIVGRHSICYDLQYVHISYMHKTETENASFYRFE
jgi:hypothetical protein